MNITEELAKRRITLGSSFIIKRNRESFWWYAIPIKVIGNDLRVSIVRENGGNDEVWYFDHTLYGIDTGFYMVTNQDAKHAEAKAKGLI